MRLRDDDGEMTQGVSVVDMGAKTVANDLDNAAFAFDGARLPRSAAVDAQPLGAQHAAQLVRLQ
jgi:acyl-CoA oxidase